MTAEIHWAIWLFSGIAVGILPMLGENRMIGWLQTLVIVGAPFVIFAKAGATYLPFALFFGGLILATSVAYKHKRAKDDKELSNQIEKNKKRLQR